MSKNEFENSYLNGKKVWLERYGSYIKREAAWRRAFFGMLILCFLLISYVFYSYEKPRVEAFAVNSCNGEVSFATPFVVDDKVVESTLSQWVTWLKEVSTDPRIIEKNVKKVYAMIPSSSLAEKQVNEFYSKENPLEKSQKETVEVKILSILKETESTYRIDWEEIKRSIKTGESQGKIIQRGTFTIGRMESMSANEFLINPTGLRIGDVRWTSVL